MHAHTEQLLGGACCDARQCSYDVWNSVCANNACECAAGFVNIGTHACAAKATTLGGPCSVNAQCMDLPGTACDVNGTCTCDAQSQFVTTMIIPVTTGAAADRRRKRQATNSAAVTQMCMPTAKLGQTCVSNQQCAARTNNTVCSMSVCTCASGFLPDLLGLTCERKYAKTLYMCHFFCKSIACHKKLPPKQLKTCSSRKPYTNSAWAAAAIPQQRKIASSGKCVPIQPAPTCLRPIRIPQVTCDLCSI